MKKISFLTLMAVCFAAGLLTTSCKDSDDSASDAKVVSVAVDKYSVFAASNLDATFSIDVAGVDAQKNVKEAAFTDLTASTITLTAKYTGADVADYVNPIQTAVIKFSKKTTSASILFTFVKKSKTTKTQVEAETKGVTLTNDDQTVGTATMTVDAGTTVTNGTSGDYAITVYKEDVTVVTAEDMAVGKDLSSNIYTVNCQPDGAEFSQPVSLTLDYGKVLTGKTVSLINGPEEVTATVDAKGLATFQVNHFSDWVAILKASIVSKETSLETIATLEVNAVAGKNSFEYKKNVGVEHTLTGFLASYVYDLLGELKTEVMETSSFEASGSGTAKVTVSQSKTTYAFDYQGLKFTATRWDNVDFSVEMNGSSKTSGHSGGAGL